MRVTLGAVAVAALLAAGCSSQTYPASPVPTHLTDREASFLGERYLIERGVPPTRLTAIEPTNTGYLFHYESFFDAPSGPPKQGRLLHINNDGTVREIWFPHEE